LAHRAPEPCTAVFASSGGISLRKLLEQLAHLLRRHTDAGICDSDRNPIAAVFLRPLRMNRNRAALRKFIAIAQEIQQGLPQPHWVGMQRPNCAVAADNELVAIFYRERLNGLDHAVDERRKRKVFELKLHAPGFDLGKVE